MFTRSAEREGATIMGDNYESCRVLEGHIALLPPNNSMKKGCISPIAISYLSNIRPPSSTSITPWKNGGWNLKIPSEPFHLHDSVPSRSFSRLFLWVQKGN